SKNPSIIAGLLQGNNNNVFIVNPSGVIVTESGSINANKFGISTSAIDTDTLNAFKEANEDNTLASFSPVFKPNGDIVINKGSIQAKEVFLVGNKVEILNKDVSIKGNTDLAGGKEYADLIDIKGNDVYINGDTLTGKNINIDVKQKGSFTQHTGDYYNKYKNDWNLGKYTFSGEGLKDFQKIGYIGYEDELANSQKNQNEWIGFANSWNKSANFRDIFTEFRLMSDINMSGAGAVEPVGFYDLFGDPRNAPFNKNFNGLGHTISNITIIADSYYTGLFGYIEGNNLKIGNVKIDGLEFEYQNGLPNFVGGFAGYIGGDNYNISNIALKNIGAIKATTSNYEFYMNGTAGGFAGWIEGGEFSNIVLNGIKSIGGRLYIGGFAGNIEKGEFSNIAVNNIKELRGYGVGGFAGDITGSRVSSISINDIEKLIDDSEIGSGYAGGFAGVISDGEIKNVTLNNIGNISGHTVAGFSAMVARSYLSNIALNNIGDITGGAFGGQGVIGAVGGFLGKVGETKVENIVMNNIGAIKSKDTIISVGGFVGEIEDGSITGKYNEFKNITMYLNNFVGYDEDITSYALTGLFVGGNYVRDGFKVDNIEINYVNNNDGGTGTDNIVGNEDISSVSYFKINKLANNQALEEQKATFKGFNNNVGKVYWDDNLKLFVALEEGKELFYKELDDGKSIMYAKNADGTIGDKNSNIIFNDKTNSFELKKDSSSTYPKDEINIPTNKGELSKVDLKESDFSKEILNQILGDLSLDLLTQDAETIKQTLEFLLAFIGEDGLLVKGLFTEEYKLTDNNVGSKLEKNLETIIKAIKDSQLNENSDLLKYRNDYLAYINERNLYWEGLKNNTLTQDQIIMLENSLKSKYESLLKREASILKIANDFIALLNNTLEVDKEYSMFANNPLKFQLGLKAVDGYECKDCGSAGSDPTLNAPLKDINASMLDKQQVVLIKPAEEEKEALDEEKGTLNYRTCVVSENFKTNNPCMAQRI
ncbi:hypothetical protein B6S12_09490, partial [Helicobacter valdiviensis]